MKSFVSLSINVISITVISMITKMNNITAMAVFVQEATQ